MSDVVQGVDLATGAYQRPRFEQELSRAVSAAHKQRSGLSVLYVDLDELQEHNDLHGLEQGDRTISSVAEVMSRELDGKGPIGRLDGGAFAVLLEDIDHQDAMVLAERIRRSVSARLSSSGSRITVSVGVASLKTSEPWGNLLEAAEVACLRAKQAGRNAVVTR